MVTKRLFWIGVVTAFLVGSMAGTGIGAWRGYRAGTALILNSALARDAREVGTRLEVLGQLRSGEVVPAVAALENGLDDILIAFDPGEPYAGLQAETVLALGRAIEQAREYRTTHPWASDQEMRARMVRSLFARDLYRSEP